MCGPSKKSLLSWIQTDPLPKIPRAGNIHRVGIVAKDLAVHVDDTNATGRRSCACESAFERNRHRLPRIVVRRLKGNCLRPDRCTRLVLGKRPLGNVSLKHGVAGADRHARS